MKFIVFYSWQSNTNLEYNKNLIGNCIQAAIKKIKNKGQLKGVTFEYQESTSNLSGTVDIIQTIEARLPKCDILIADLTVVNAYTWVLENLRIDPNLEYSFLQNPNVIIEYSRALAASDKIEAISVMNSFYGDPHQNDKVLPFDLRTKRFPLTYHCSNSDEVRSSEEKLISFFEDALKKSTLSLIEKKRFRYVPFISYTEHNFEFKSKCEYCTNYKLDEMKSAITSSKKDIRLLGLSGIGKTRLVLDLTRNSDSLKQIYLYCDVFNDNYDEIFKKVDSIFRDNEEHFLVIDNCEKKDAEKLSNLKRRYNAEKVRLLTISNQDDEYVLESYQYLKIGAELSEVVDEIIDKKGLSISNEHKRLIKEFSDGIPLMAILLIESLLAGSEDIGTLTNKDFVNKLVFSTDDEREILKACSLFKFIGFSNDLKEQINSIVLDPAFTPLRHGDESYKLTLLEQVIKKYREKEIIEINGRMLGIRPRPLAFALAEEWFDGCPSERMESVILKLQDPKNPHGASLTEALSKQIIYLGNNEKVKSLISSLSRSGGSFYNAKVLNTKLGSRLFRSFVEVNPEAVANCLYDLYIERSRDELLLVREGRRNLIWTLQKVCFDKRTFIKGAQVLMSFSVAENENLANNATGIFLQLFRVALPGTQADLTERLNIINWGIERENKEFRKLALEAIYSAFKSESFSYSNGAEKQGTKTLEHYYPPLLEEIYDYWGSLLEIIERQIKSSDLEMSIRSSEILATRLRHIVRLRGTEKLLEILARVIEYKNNEWDELLDPLHDLTNYEKENLSEDQLQQIKHLIVQLTKNDFLSRFKEIDKQRRRKYRDLSFEESLNIRRQEYSTLADEFLKSDIGDKKEILKAIFEDKDIFPAGFGRRLSELVANNLELGEWFVEVCLSIFKLDKTQYNTFIFLEYCQNLTNSQFDFLVHKLSKEEKISSLLFSILAKRNTSFYKLDILFDLINSGRATVKHFVFFFDNAIITPDKDYEIERLLNQLKGYTQDGRYVILQIAYRNIFLFRRIDEGYPLVLDLVLQILSNTSFKDLDSGDAVFKLSAKILSLPSYPAYAKHVTKELIQLAETFDIMFSFDHQVENLFGLLLENYFDEIWPDLSQALLAENERYVVFHNLKNLLGSLNGSDRKSGLLFQDENKHQLILEWAKCNPSLAPERLAAMIPVFNGDGFSSIAIALLDNFGDDNDMLSSLSANMGSFSWVGSTLPFYKNKIERLEVLLTHKNRNVVSWAQKQIEYARRELESERTREDEDNLYYGR